jgi:hypothetical protein
MNKYAFIRDLAIRLRRAGSTMTVQNLAIQLNSNGYLTSYGTNYMGARGTYTLVHAVYDWLAGTGQQNDADCVAEAFTKWDGSYAYN